jgi:hypothetical protein
MCLVLLKHRLASLTIENNGYWTSWDSWDDQLEVWDEKVRLPDGFNGAMKHLRVLKISQPGGGN